MTTFPRADYASLSRYDPERRPVPVDLSDNTNLWGTHPEALDVVRNSGDEELARYPELYARDLRAAVSRRFHVPTDSICTGCGSDDVLDAAWRACAEPGGVVAYTAPTFSMVEPLCRMNAREPMPVPWSAALTAPELLLTADPVLVYLCRPNNPTGEQAPEEWLEAVIDAAAAQPGGGPLVIVDEAYAEFAGESYVKRALSRDRVLVCRTMSKAYGLAGMRVGFGVGAPAVVDEVEKARGPFKVSQLAALAAIAALDDASGWGAETIRKAVRNRDRLKEELTDRGLTVLPSASNFLFVRVGAGQAKEKARALHDRGVAVRPFPNEPDVGDGLRISVGPWTMMETLLDAFDGALADSSDGWYPPSPEGSTS